MEGNWDIFGILALVISNVGIWIREWKKSQSFKSKNGQLDEMRLDIKSTMTGVTALETRWEDHSKYCDTTVKALITELRSNRDKIYELKHD